MKLAIICDTHWGARGDHLGFLDHFERFHMETFFPEIKARGINTIVHLGDLVDRRKYINYFTASRMRKCFLEPAGEFNTVIIAGNHDVYHKNTNEVNAIRELCAQYPKMQFFDEPCHITFDRTDVLLLPWINNQNKDRSMEMIHDTKALVCMGHLEISGFEYTPGTYHTGSFNASTLQAFNSVLTGHFHHKSDRGNIHYLGSPYQMTWSDYADPRGFHIFDTDTLELEFIQNPEAMFFKIIYDDSKEEDVEQLLKADFSKYTKRYVKILVIKKDNPMSFERLLDKLEKANPFDMQVVENHMNMSFDDDPEILESTQDTFTILRNYIKTLPKEIDKIGLEKLLKTVYDEASLIQS